LLVANNIITFIYIHVLYSSNDRTLHSRHSSNFIITATLFRIAKHQLEIHRIHFFEYNLFPDTHASYIMIAQPAILILLPMARSNINIQHDKIVD